MNNNIIKGNNEYNKIQFKLNEKNNENAQLRQVNGNLQYKIFQSNEENRKLKEKNYDLTKSFIDIEIQKGYEKNKCINSFKQKKAV